MEYNPETMIEAVLPIFHEIERAAYRRLLNYGDLPPLDPAITPPVGQGQEYWKALPDCAFTDWIIQQGIQKTTHHLTLFGLRCTGRVCPDIGDLEILQSAILALHEVRERLEQVTQDHNTSFQHRLYEKEEKKLRALGLSLFSLLLHACVMRMRTSLESLCETGNKGTHTTQPYKHLKVVK